MQTQRRKMNLQETVCWVRSYWLKLEREYVLEWLFTQLAKHVVVGELFIIVWKKIQCGEAILNLN